MAAQRSSSSPSTMSSACDGAASATAPSSSGPDGDNVTSRIALRGTRDRTMSGMTARTRKIRPQCGMSGSTWSAGRSCVTATSLRCVGSLTASLSGSARQHRTGRRPTSQRVRALEAAVRAPCSGSGCPVAEVADDDPEGGNPQLSVMTVWATRADQVDLRGPNPHDLARSREDWSMMGAQLQEVAAPALVVVDGEAAITVLAQRLWPAAPIQRCWWHLPHGLRKAFYADDAANRHVNPRWARTMAGELAERLREQIRGEHTTEQALADWDAFSARIPAALTSAHAYLDAARPHVFTCLDPDLRKALARLGGPELAAGVIERLMRELNARTDIGGVRWTIAGLRDLLTVLTARALRHPAWTEIRRNTRPSNTIQFRLQKFNAT